MPQSTRLGGLYGNPKSSFRGKNKAHRHRVGRFTNGLLFSLSLLSGRAAAFHFAPGDNTPVNARTAKIATGDVTSSPWNVITRDAASTSTRSTIIVPTNSTTNVTTVDTPNDSTPIQFTIVNGCGEPIWPGIVTQNGIGPAAGGYKLTPGTSRKMFVSADWAGRI
ncbi:hypothetical protein B0I37DRAFT_41133 [Chaetomium sp. MPI-CAGE-AT-0009]|nr:hypothetical protein B0I37DRAFT_41133 [Chaetomium sp. MPI-CAGE-AT-0009]